MRWLWRISTFSAAWPLPGRWRICWMPSVAKFQTQTVAVKGPRSWKKVQLIHGATKPWSTLKNSTWSFLGPWGSCLKSNLILFLYLFVTWRWSSLRLFCLQSFSTHVGNVLLDHIISVSFCIGGRWAGLMETQMPKPWRDGPSGSSQLFNVRWVFGGLLLAPWAKAAWLCGMGWRGR